MNYLIIILYYGGISYKQGMRTTKNSASNPKNWKSLLYLNFVFYERKNDYYLFPTIIHNNNNKKKR